MAASDALPIPRKNVAYRVTFPILDADGDLVTGATGLDSEVSKDAGTFADCTNEATEIATSSGIYYLDLTSTEMNADTVAIIVKTSSSGAKTTTLVIYPEEAGDTRADVVMISGDSTAADNAEAFFDGTGYAGTNNVIPTVTTLTNKTGFSLVSTGLDLVTAWTTNITGNLSGSVGSVTGAVGSVTGNVGGNVVGSVASVTGAVGSVTGAVGSVTGNVGGNVVGSVGSISGITFPTNFSTILITSDGYISRVVLTDTLTTYTSNTPQTGDSFARIGAAGAGLTALASQTSVDDLPTNAELATALGTADDATLAQIALVKAKTDLIPAAPAAVGDIPTAGAIADAVLDEALSGHATAGTVGKALSDADTRGSRVVARGTIGSGSTTTSVVSSALSPAGAVADQFKGRIIVFDNDTTTAALRGQATDITASSNSATPTFTVTALTTAPASGDTFSIL